MSKETDETSFMSFLTTWQLTSKLDSDPTLTSPPELSLGEGLGVMDSLDLHHPRLFYQKPGRGVRADIIREGGGSSVVSDGSSTVVLKHMIQRTQDGKQLVFSPAAKPNGKICLSVFYLIYSVCFCFVFVCCFCLLNQERKQLKPGCQTNW